MAALALATSAKASSPPASPRCGSISGSLSGSLSGSDDGNNSAREEKGLSLAAAIAAKKPTLSAAASAGSGGELCGGGDVWLCDARYRLAVRGGRKGFKDRKRFATQSASTPTKRPSAAHPMRARPFCVNVKPFGVPSAWPHRRYHFVCVGVQKVGAAQWAWRQAASLLQALFQQAHAHELARRRRTHEAVTCWESLLYGVWSIDAAC
jgi:hypothetical protein